MRLIFLGAPGAGKGTYAAVLSEQLGITTISTGDILRENVKRDTSLGREAKAFMERGALVPDELVTRMLAERLGEPDVKAGFILDGFPRTLAQAEALGKLLQDKKIALTAAVNIEVPREVLIRRLTGRRSCPACGANYNVNTNLRPKRDEMCDRCGAQLITRSDDRLETIRTRLEVYAESTAPLIDYYRNAGLLRTVAAEGEISAIVDRIRAAVAP